MRIVVTGAAGRIGRALLSDLLEHGHAVVAVEHTDLAGAEVPGLARDTRVYVYCKTGVRSAEAVDLLRARGVDAVNVEGGILAWGAEIEPHLPTY